ncbi:MAG: peptide-methionine (S)-S-oxide reductase MsrA [Desulfovibrionaceae bacterium]
MKKLYLGGGCFWGMEAYFKSINGIIRTEVGYGHSIVEKPTYEELCSGRTKAVEVLYIEYDEMDISLNRVLFHYMQNIDPTTLNRQGNDIGTQYRTGIYYVDESDFYTIQVFLQEEAKKYPTAIVVEVISMDNYYRAEEYHQNYLGKNPLGYCHNLEAIDMLRTMPGYRENGSDD